MLSERELASRVEINWERYVKVGDIEASCALDIARTMILPAAVALPRRARGGPGVEGASTVVCVKVAGLADGLVDAIDASSTPSTRPTRRAPSRRRPRRSSTKVIPAQDALREVADELETLVADDLWPLPKYRELLFQY